MEGSTFKEGCLKTAKETLKEALTEEFWKDVENEIDRSSTGDKDEMKDTFKDYKDEIDKHKSENYENHDMDSDLKDKVNNSGLRDLINSKKCTKKDVSDDEYTSRDSKVSKKEKKYQNFIKDMSN